MEQYIQIKDLPCFDLATDEGARRTAVRRFSLSAYPEVMQPLLAGFIRFRGNGQIKAASLAQEIWPFTLCGGFFRSLGKPPQNLADSPLSEWERKLTKYLMKKGYPPKYSKKKKESGTTSYRSHDAVIYLRKLYAFCLPEESRPEKEKDLWDLSGMDMPLRMNPAHPARTIDFSDIRDEGMCQEIREACWILLKDQSVATVKDKKMEAARLVRFLNEWYLETRSLADVTRDIWEAYLLYLKTESGRRQSYRTVVHHLRSILDLIFRMHEKTPDFFLDTDIPREPGKVFRVYSEEEIRRLNNAIVEMHPQIARALFIHELLGTRISDTLTLSPDCLFTRDGITLIRIYQCKTGKSYTKTADEKTEALIQASIRYTEERFGSRPYIFVDERCPDNPMKYGRIQYHLMAMIREKNLQDDRGERFGVGTHLFRHTYGRKLTEMHFDDALIARLLGHSNTSSVRYYRRMSSSVLAEEARDELSRMDAIIREITKEWEL